MNFSLHSHGRVPLLGALVLLLATTSCQLVAGIEKADHDPSQDSTTSTDNGSGGSDNGGSGGSAQGSTPVSGIRGATYAPSSCSSKLDLNQDTFESCLQRVSCDPSYPAFSISDCVTFDLLNAYPSESCSQNATSCDQIYSCLHRRPPTTTELQSCVEEDSYNVHDVNNETCAGVCEGSCDGYCDGLAVDDGNCVGFCSSACTGSCYSYSLKAWSCVDNWAVECGTQMASHNCSEYNAECGESLSTDPNSTGGCMPSADSDGGPVACDTNSETDAVCNGKTLSWCSGGQAWGYDCDTACVIGESGAYCSLVSETCDSPSSGYCDGDTVDFCNSDGLYSVHSCEQSNLTCLSEDVSINCVASGCETSTCTESCVDEKTAQFCIGGAAIQVDCTEYGFDVCHEGMDGSITTARCQASTPLGDDSCVFANDDICDEPTDCAAGTDATDCRGSN